MAYQNDREKYESKNSGVKSIFGNIESVLGLVTMSHYAMKCLQKY